MKSSLNEARYIADTWIDIRYMMIDQDFSERFNHFASLLHKDIC